MSGSRRQISLDDPAPIFLTNTATTEPPYFAPAPVQQGLQPIMLKLERPNPSRRVKNFRQGLSRVGLRCATFWTAITPKLNDISSYAPTYALPGPGGHLLAL